MTPRHRTDNVLARAVWTLALGSTLAFSAAAWAQPVVGARTLDPAIPAATSLTTDQQAQIRAFVDQVKPDLTGDQVAVAGAREALTRPLRGQRVTTTFRLEYAGLVEAAIRPLIDDQRELVASNACLIAGELATPAGSTLLQRALLDGRAPVRYAAAVGFRRTFEQVRVGPSAFAERQLTEALGELVKRLSAEPDARVLEGVVRAIDAATLVPSEIVPGLRARAVTDLAAQMGKRARTDLDLSLDASARAGEALRNAVVRQGVPASEARLPDDALREVGGFAGDLLSAIKCRVASAGPSEPERPRFSAAATVAVAAYFFAHQELGRGQALDVPLGAMLRDGKDAEFTSAVDQFIGPSGTLLAPPFALPATRFKCP